MLPITISSALSRLRVFFKEDSILEVDFAKEELIEKQLFLPLISEVSISLNKKARSGSAKQVSLRRESSLILLAFDLRPRVCLKVVRLDDAR